MSDTIPNIGKLSNIVGNHKSFILRIVQHGLAGLMDGAVSPPALIRYRYFKTSFALPE